MAKLKPIYNKKMLQSKKGWMKNLKSEEKTNNEKLTRDRRSMRYHIRQNLKGKW